MTFGQAIARARKDLALSQKELAQRLLKEDGVPISPQYLNDIERDRRKAPSHQLLDQLSDELGLPVDYLHYLAGQLPGAVTGGNYGPEQVECAFVAFRKSLRGDEEG